MQQTHNTCTCSVRALLPRENLEEQCNDTSPSPYLLLEIHGYVVGLFHSFVGGEYNFNLHKEAVSKVVGSDNIYFHVVIV